MKHRYRGLLCCTMLMAAAAGTAGGADQNTEHEISEKIRAKIAPIYRKYIGVECKREIISMQYDSRDNTYQGTYTVLLDRKEYFYKRAKYTVLKYVKDGKETAKWKYRPRTLPPAFPPFDPESDKHYDIRLAGKKAIQGVPCWEFEIIPKKKNSRHIKGRCYFTVKGLDLFYLEGTVADLPFGVKSVDLEIFFKKVEDAYVLSHGTYTFVVHVPVFYPHKKFVQKFTSSEDRLIPVKQ